MKRLKNKKIMIGLISMIIFTICAFCLMNKKTSLFLKSKEYMIEYGQPISQDIKDYLDTDKTNQDVINSSKLHLSINNEEGQNYPAIGEYEGTITYQKETVNFQIIVKDTIAPVIKEVKNREVIQNCPLTLEEFTKNIVVEDLSKVSISLDDHQVDYTKAGQYHAVIKVNDESGNETTKSISITIVSPTITLNQQTASLYVKDNMILTATIKGKDQKAKFESSDPSIASIDDNGKVTAIKKGTVTLTASANGVKATCQVTVKALPSSPTKNTGNSSTQKNEEVIVVQPSSSYDLTSAKQAFELQNQKRQAQGLSPLTWSNEVYNACKIRAQELEQSFSHTRPNGSSCFTVLDECHISYWGAGENIAMGYTSANSVVTGWYNSEGHKANILGDFTHGAIARYGQSWVALFTKQ